MRHFSDDELIDLVYGTGVDEGHLNGCQECSCRLRGVLERRQSLVAPPEIPPRLLARQRAEIYERLGAGGTSMWSYRPPAFAAALGVLVLALVLSRPAPKPEPSMAANDSQFFTEVYTIVEASEPAAAAPIRGLFEEQP